MKTLTAAALGLTLLAGTALSQSNPPASNAPAATKPATTTSSSASSTNDAAELSIAADVGPSPGIVTGTSLVVSPAANTVYTLTAKNSSGTVTRTVAVTVNPPPPQIASFVAAPGTIKTGESTQLSWSVTGAAELSLVADVGPSPGVVTGNSLSVSPLAGW